MAGTGRAKGRRRRWLSGLPVKPANDRLADTQGIHKRHDIDPKDRLLAIPECRTGQKAGRAIAAQVRDDHPVPRCGQHGRDPGIAVNVVGPPMQKNDRPAISRAGFGVSHAQQAASTCFSVPNGGSGCSDIRLFPGWPEVGGTSVAHGVARHHPRLVPAPAAPATPAAPVLN